MRSDATLPLQLLPWHPLPATVIDTWCLGRYVEPVARLRPSTKRVHGHCGHHGRCGHYLSDAQISQTAIRPSLWDVFPMISATKRVHGHCGHHGHCGYYLSDAQISQAAVRPSLWDVFPMISATRLMGCKGIDVLVTSCYIELLMLTFTNPVGYCCSLGVLFPAHVIARLFETIQVCLIY